MLTGRFINIILFMYLIFIHEFGHSLMIVLKKYELLRIELYPYGGCSKYNSLINISLKDEFLILIFGPLFQIIGFFILSFFLDYRYLSILRFYNSVILIFNMLPIYPLDGGKLLHIFISYFLSFKLSFRYLFYISFVSFFIVFYVYLRFIRNILFLIVLILLYIKFISEIFKFSLYYNKFLVERYLYDFSYLPRKRVHCLDNFKRNRYHVVCINNKNIDEREYLKEFFISLNEERRVL